MKNIIESSKIVSNGNTKVYWHYDNDKIDVTTVTVFSVKCQTTTVEGE